MYSTDRSPDENRNPLSAKPCKALYSKHSEYSKKRIEAPFMRGMCAAVLALAIATVTLSVGCAADATGTSTSASTTDGTTTTVSADTSGMDFTYSDRDTDASYDETTATVVTLSDEGITVDGEGASAEGSTLTITAEGTYIVSGELTDGSILIEAADTEKVQLVLDGVDITNSTGPALLVEQADKVFVTLAEGSQNTLADGQTHETGSDESDHDGAVFSHSDITFNGSGSLAVDASYSHGIVSKDDLVITGGVYSVNAPGDALQGKDCVKILDGTFTLVAGDDGIKATNAEDTTRGFIGIDGGTFTITASGDGVQAETVLRLTAGTIDLTTGGGATGAIATTDGFGMGGAGEMQGSPNDGNATNETTTVESDTTVSTKGLKGGAGVEIYGGSVVANCLDDTVHSNGTVTMTGGSLTLTTDGDGMHADGVLTIDGGTVDITQCYEGLEGSSVNINEGEIYLVASDDGINAASDSASSWSVSIAGGFVFIDASGDGIDSNGTLTISGGTVLVSGATSSSNGALDFQGTGTVTGGTVVALGYSGMAQTFSTDSSQPAFSYTPSTTQEAGSTISVADETGALLFTFEAPKSYNSIVVSTSDLVVGGNYTVYTGSTLPADAVAGFGLGGTVDDATELVGFTLSEMSVSVSASGEVSTATQGGMGGGQNGGTAGGGPGGEPGSGGQGRMQG